MPFLSPASSAAGRVDTVFLYILILCAAVLLFITTTLIYFVIRYNRKRHPKGEDIHGKTWLEIVWTVIPTILFLAMFFFGWTNFNYMREVPRNAMVIEVTGRQWAWSFKYPNGRQTKELLLALDKPFKLELRSLDVIHGFFIPAFRIKEDVVPGKENYTWFVPTQLGSFDIECTVICGVSHADMLAKAVVVPQDDFEKWYYGDETMPLPGHSVKTETAVNDTGRDETNPALTILNEKFCTQCHSIDGTALVGPSFKGLYGEKRLVTDLEGRESEIKVDDTYLEKSIQDPMAETVKGYPNAMPINPLADGELQLVVAYIKSLK